MPEISDQELEILQGSKKLMDQLLKSPKTKLHTERLVKTLYPDTQTTDDIAAPYVAKISDLEKKLDGFLKKQHDNELDSKFNSELDELRRSGYTDDGIAKVKELMVKEQIPSALAAAAWWEKKNPPVQEPPSSFAPSSWGIGQDGGDENLKSMFSNEDDWAEREARKVWEETAKKNQIIS